MSAEPIDIDLELEVFERADRMRLHRHGRQASFDDLYRRFHPRLVRYCRFKTGDEALAEDIAQETLLRALDNLDRFDPRRPLWPWLKTVAGNLATDHARRRGRESRLCEAVAAECEPVMHDDSLEFVHERPLLKQALSALPERQRTALALRYLNEWTHDEAAAELGLSRPAFKQLLLRGRRALGTEYRRLAGPEMRLGAFLPFPLILARLRARITRLATMANEFSANSVAMAADTLSIMAVVTALGITAGVGVASAADGRSVPEAPAVSTRMVSTHVSAAKTSTPTVKRRANQVAPRIVARDDRNQRATTTTPVAAASGSSMTVSVVPRATGENGPKAAAELGRNDDEVTLQSTVETTTDEAEQDVARLAPGGSLHCGEGGTREGACNSAEEAIETANEELPTAP